MSSDRSYMALVYILPLLIFSLIKLITHASASADNNIPAPVAASLAKETTYPGGILYRIYRSPELWSGHGKNYSGWYDMKTPPTPSGYRLWQQMYSLEGDRMCMGAGDELVMKDIDADYAQWVVSEQKPGYRPRCGWSEVVLEKRDDSGVQYKFRMQGHEERKKFVFDGIEAQSGDGIKMKYRWEGDAATSVALIVVKYAPPDYKSPKVKIQRPIAGKP